VRELSRGESVSAGVLAMEAITIVGLVVASGWVIRWRRQVQRAGRELTRTPPALVDELIATRERQLFWTGDRRVWLPAVVFLLGVAAATLYAGYELSAAGRDATVFWAISGMLVAVLILQGTYSWFRVRFLRRELRSLREIRAELLDAEEE
jgi:hypothetical protein